MPFLLIFHQYLRFSEQGIDLKSLAFQICVSQPDPCDAAVFVGGVIIIPGNTVAAAAVDGFLTFFTDPYAALLLADTSKYVKYLTNTIELSVPGY